MLSTTVLLVACGSGETITQTVTRTQEQTVTQTETLTETQEKTVTQTETLTETQTETITITTTAYTSNPQTTTPPNTTTPPVTTSTPPTNSEPATFSVSDMTIEPRIPAPGLPFTISVTVTNTDDSQGSCDVILIIDELDVQDLDNPIVISTMTYTESVIVAAGESKIVTFHITIHQNGIYTVTIDDLVDYLEVGS